MKTFHACFFGSAIIFVGLIGISLINRQVHPESYDPLRVVDQQPVDVARPKLIIFTAWWCAPCGLLERRTLADPSVKARLTGYQVQSVDVDFDRATAAKYGVVKWPTYLVEDAGGKIVKRGEGFRSPQAFIQWLVD